jgi:hypothetical protein
MKFTLSSVDYLDSAMSVSTSARRMKFPVLVGILKSRFFVKCM